MPPIRRRNFKVIRVENQEMKTTRRRILSGLLLACMLVLMVPVVSMAATGKIMFTDPNTEVGQEVSVNMRVNADASLGRAEIMLAYDAAALEFIEGNSVEGGAGALRAHGGPDAGDLKNIVFTMKFRALKPGTSQITITSCEVYDNDTQAVTISHQGTSTITIAGTESIAAGDGFLASLAVVPGTLTPAFSPAIDTYSIHVGMDVESVDVQALAAEGSTVAIEGNEGLQMGENTITIKVTASDGITVKNYTISVNKSEGGESAVPDTALQGVSLEAAAKAITILPPEEGVTLPEGFTATTIDIDGYKATGFIWTAESDHQYCVFYAMNAAGEKNFYRYDLTEKTIQRYFQDPAMDTGITQEDYIKVAEDYNNLLEDYKIRLYLIIALAAVVAILLIIVVVLLVFRKPESPHDRNRTKDGAEPERTSRRRELSREERYLRGEEESDAEGYPPKNTAQIQQTTQNRESLHEDFSEEDFESMEFDEPQDNRANMQTPTDDRTNGPTSSVGRTSAQAQTGYSTAAADNMPEAFNEPESKENPEDETDEDFEFLDI